MFHKHILFLIQISVRRMCGITSRIVGECGMCELSGTTGQGSARGSAMCCLRYISHSIPSQGTADACTM